MPLLRVHKIGDRIDTRGLATSHIHKSIRNNNRTNYANNTVLDFI